MRIQCSDQFAQATGCDELLQWLPVPLGLASANATAQTVQLLQNLCNADVADERLEI